MYSKCKEIIYGGVSCLETPRNFVIKPHDDDTYFKVTSEFVNRLDLISYNVYGSCNYFWIIAIANNISNPMDIKLNTVLRMPSLTTIFGVINGGDK